MDSWNEICLTLIIAFFALQFPLVFLKPLLKNLVVGDYRVNLGMTLMGSTEGECQPEGVLVSLGISLEEHFLGLYFLDLPHSVSEGMFVKYAKNKMLGESVMVVVGKRYLHFHFKSPDGLKK